MVRSKADRPYGAFLKGVDPPEPPQPPPRRSLRARLLGLRDRTRTAQVIGASVIITFGIIGLANVMAPALPRLTESDIRTAVRDALASATPKPNVAVDAYEKVKRSVVTVRTRYADEATLQSRGSGILLDTGGRVITSLHVVAGVAEVEVIFFDGTDAPAIVEATDPATGIAVLDAAGIGQTPAILASPKSLRVGDEAIIVGSPLGLATSLSQGVVSGLNRTFKPAWSSQQLSQLIQFDAPLLPGNEGGPLVNRRGEVIGIVVASAGPAGLPAFATPINALSTAAGNTPF